MKDMKEKKRIKKNIRVGYIVKVKVRDIEENTRRRRRRRTRKEVVVCVQYVVGRKNLLVRF